jgi:amino acid permease
MKKNLTVIEASSIIMGAGVGGGVMAVPFLAARAGLFAFVPIVLIGFALNVLLNLMLTEILLRDGRNLQIVELIRTYVFRGRVGATVAWVFFAVLGLSFIASLTAYVSGAGLVIAELLGIGPLLSRLVVYVFSAAVVFFGLKGVGFSEKIALFLMLLFTTLIVLGSIGTWEISRHTFGLETTRWKDVLALYGIVLYSLNAAFAVPQAVKGLDRNPKKSVQAVLIGTSINTVLVVIVTFVAIAVSKPVTEVAVVGIGLATNRFVSIIGSLFVVFAMLTTYWSVSLALSDIVSERFGTGTRVSWFVATAPTLLLIVFGLLDFVEYLQIAGGIVALLLVYITVPMYRRAKREGAVTDPGWSLGRIGSVPILSLFILGMILMAVGSFFGL